MLVAGRRRVVYGHTGATDRAAGTRDLKCGVDSLLESHAFEDGVRAEAAGQLADALDGLVAALGDDIAGAELPPERSPLRVVAEEDDLPALPRPSARVTSS